MSAAARGAAGYLYASGRLRRGRRKVLRATPSDVERFERYLVARCNVSPARAKAMAAEQGRKGFSTAAQAANRR